MSTRKATENADERPSKRQCVGGNDDGLDTVCSFDNLNTDCKVHIFSFLTSEDMNTAAICSKDCQQVRANESLDQRRTATLVWTDRTTLCSFFDKLRELQDVFTGNRTRFKVVGLEKSTEFITRVGGGGDDVDDDDEYEDDDDVDRRRLERHADEGIPLDRDVVERLMEGVCFEQVTSLDCSCRSSNIPGRGARSALRALSLILPNLIELDMSNTVPTFAIYDFVTESLLLTKLRWNGCNRMFQCGHYLKDAANLTHLHVNDVVFSDEVIFTNELLGGMTTPIPASWMPEWWLLVKCPNLQCLSMKGATIKESETEEIHPLSQDALIKMVRGHPTLRWLQSDLTADNVAMLKRERPEITFVSE